MAVADWPVIISISSDAEDDLIDGYWFYERHHPGLGDYFRSCLIADIESLAFYAGIHELYLVFIDFFQSVFRSVSIIHRATVLCS
jgi:hypothetical protein